MHPSITQEQFEQLHGDSVPDPENGWLLYQDGARQELTGSAYGVWEDAPESELERAKRIERYYEIILAQAVEEFANYKDQLNRYQQAAKRYRNAALLPDKREVMAELKRLARNVKRAQQKQTAAKLTRDALQPRHASSAEQDAARANALAAEFWAEVSQIEI